MRDRFFAPAKVNLRLKVLSRRSDGYHNIFSIVDPLSLCDVIHIEETGDDGITVKDDRGVLPVGRANTMYRAVMLLRERFNISRGVRIMVEKRIPIGSGLGGPSSDAATVLEALNSMWHLSLGFDELLLLGATIGADVPLFLYGKPCAMSGIGERISPMSLPPIWYTIVYPNVALSTKAVYESLRISLTNGENDIKVERKIETIRDVAGILENDLEAVGIFLCPKIEIIKERLVEAGARGALMSGSGSSVFGIFESQKDAESAAQGVGSMGSVFVAHSIEKGGPEWTLRT
jgi:4-diphosphocytidyl-2-C-methyl-D-erythritol kinase